jgi:hypothetical protein
MIEILFRFFKINSNDEKLAYLNLTLHYWELIMIILLILVFSPNTSFWPSDFDDFSEDIKMLSPCYMTSEYGVDIEEIKEDELNRIEKEYRERESRKIFSNS